MAKKNEKPVEVQEETKVEAPFETTPVETVAETAPVETTPVETKPVLNVVAPQPEPVGTLSDAEYFGFDEKTAARFNEKNEEIESDLVVLFGGHLASYAKVGMKARSVMKMSITSMKNRREKVKGGVAMEWKEDDFDSYCESRAVNAMRRGAIGGAKQKAKSVIRLAECVKASVWLDEAIALAGEKAKDLPWSAVVNYFIPKCFKFSKKTLDGEIRSDWSEFTKRWIELYENFGAAGTEFVGESDYRGHLAAAIEAREAELKAEKDGKKTAEQLANEAKSKAATEAKAAKNRASAAIVKAITTALAGIMTPEEVANEIAEVAKTMEVELPVTSKAASLSDIHKVIGMVATAATEDDMTDLAKSLYANGKRNELTAINEMSGRLLAVDKPRLAVANG